MFKNSVGLHCTSCCLLSVGLSVCLFVRLFVRLSMTVCFVWALNLRTKVVQKKQNWCELVTRQEFLVCQFLASWSGQVDGHTMCRHWADMDS